MAILYYSFLLPSHSGTSGGGMEGEEDGRAMKDAYGRKEGAEPALGRKLFQLCLSIYLLFPKKKEKGKKGVYVCLLPPNTYSCVTIHASYSMKKEKGRTGPIIYC